MELKLVASLFSFVNRNSRCLVSAVPAGVGSKTIGTSAPERDQDSSGALGSTTGSTFVTTTFIQTVRNLKLS